MGCIVDMVLQSAFSRLYCRQTGKRRKRFGRQQPSERGIALVEVFAASWGAATREGTQGSTFMALGKVWAGQKQWQFGIHHCDFSSRRPVRQNTHIRPGTRHKIHDAATIHRMHSLVPHESLSIACLGQAAESLLRVPPFAASCNHLHIASAAASLPQVRQPVAGPRLMRAVLREAQQPDHFSPQ